VIFDFEKQFTRKIQRIFWKGAKQMAEKRLAGKIAVVAGATRGAGRGIALGLGRAGATVYCTGRSVRGQKGSGMGRPETIDETAELVSKAGGVGLAVRVDHRDENQVKALFEKVKAEQGGLDILVNDIWGGEPFTGSEMGKPFWELSVDQVLQLLETAVNTHIITARYGAPLLIARGKGLLIEVTDGDTFRYRGNLAYDLVKNSTMRLAYAMSEDLKPHNVAALSLTPGFLRSEEMLDHFGVTEENWKDATSQEEHFIASETPYYIGEAVAALAADPAIMAKTGTYQSTWKLKREYNFYDKDGFQPDWGKYFEERFPEMAAQ
jgi:NAD(P)-dependent dehydrogenase (short-subunit alcohol dehydrogenase family)